MNLRIQPGRIGLLLLLASGTSSVLADGSVSSQLGQGLQTLAAEATTVPVTVYTAAKIVTTERGQPTATAVAVAGKRIVAAGSLDQVKKVLGTRPYAVDDTFRNKVVMPGFIDQHLHPILGALTLAVEVIAPEAWNLPGRTIKAANGAAEYQARVKAA
jgi:predicted amidohydrolase YtcJ